ncbi:hypothetical protein BBOV_II005284 [Babesia bovis T2Bo]|uniref:hypothetical protein n=1 Tax=Babesia bovis T2Bo TaxID=484906 RepID=UPI001C3560CA|nr:hypothetical protein BBOV_II005284 [Babesia bovis T2Bo]KAG6440149.1 hypothetical protein BBOV_II005284 [Babesia bovis T2Bo]
MRFLPYCRSILLCLYTWLIGAHFRAFSSSIADLKIEEQDQEHAPIDFSVKEFWEKNQVLLSENTLVISFLTEEEHE